jgi:hypothetical protein
MIYGILFEKIENGELPSGFYYADVPALGLRRTVKESRGRVPRQRFAKALVVGKEGRWGEYDYEELTKRDP